MEPKFRMAEKKDAELVIDIYNSAFYDDYIRYGECPAYGRTRENMEKSIILYPKMIAYHQHTAVGVISWRNIEPGKYYVGCLGVKKEYQGCGIGTLLMKQLLSEFPDWNIITLITPADKEENIRFYRNCLGFEVFGEEYDGKIAVCRLQLKRG